jgi:polyphosphate kinase 2 (PPK2 family)
LWRVHNAVPEWGMIGIFNRSHYEDVLVVRVHGLEPKSTWSKRYQQINDFGACSANRACASSSSCFISAKRSSPGDSARLKDKSKNWRFSPADIKGREYWDQYIEAFTFAVRSALQPRFSL